MSNLYLFNYNNYFNRIVKKKNTLVEYGTPIYSLIETSTKKVNFNYNDGVRTEHVINYDGSDGDYLIVCDNENNIVSRWFVIENVRVRGGQHKLSLKRDLMVDFLDAIRANPMLVNRGYITNVDNPLMLNSEGMDFNQVKTYEYPLKDILQVPWYVLYFKRDAEPKTIAYDSTAQPDFFEPNIDLSNLVGSDKYFYQTSEGRFLYYSTDGIEYVDGWYVKYRADINDVVPNNISFTEIERTRFKGFRDDIIWFTNPQERCEVSLTNAFKNKYNEIESRILATAMVDPSSANYINASTYSKYLSWNDKTVKDITGKVYRVFVNDEDATIDSDWLDEDITNSYVTYCRDQITNTDLTRDGDWGDSFRYLVHRRRLSITIREVVNATGSIEVCESAKTKTYDSDYRIVALPADTCYMQVAEEGALFTITKERCDNFVKNCMMSYSENELVDIQYLPYCPYQAILGRYNGNKTIITHQVNASVYNYKTDVPIMILYVPYANFSFNIDQVLVVENQYNEEDVPRTIDYKFYNDTKVYRLVSPNGNGQFEFNVAKNNGSVDYFNVDVTLKPIQPYIHINPNFKGLYGNDFNDLRGLICQGNFSIPRHSDPFIEYEYNNRNYQNAFERGIKNLDFKQSQERVRANVNALFGVIGGATAGAVSGSKMGGPVGAGIGAVVGAGASAVGGILDYNMLSERQAEDRAYAFDTYRYQLGNVKALSENVTGVTPLTFNNKIFPYVELYECTDQEAKAYMNYIEYRSMTIGVIDYFDNYVRVNNITFIQGELLRLDNLNCSSNEAYEIDNEIMKGVYYDSRED